MAARSFWRVRVSPWSRSECSFSWLMVIEEKGHDKHLYVCCSPEGDKQTALLSFHGHREQQGVLTVLLSVWSVPL